MRNAAVFLHQIYAKTASLDALQRVGTAAAVATAVLSLSNLHHAMQTTSVSLGSPMIVDPIHGSQIADGSATVVVGLPATFVATFDFTLPPLDASPCWRA